MRKAAEVALVNYISLKCNPPPDPVPLTASQGRGGGKSSEGRPQDSRVGPLVRRAVPSYIKQGRKILKEYNSSANVEFSQFSK